MQQYIDDPKCPDCGGEAGNCNCPEDDCPSCGA